MDHVYAVSVDPVTVAEKDADCPLVNEIHVGEMETLTKGIKVTTAERVGWPELVAVTVT
jgi:hypothetical protein